MPRSAPFLVSSLATALIAIGLGACSRTPPEPEPAMGASTAPSAAAVPVAAA
ncbi:MAG: hypothetical protein JWP97_4036, partial [Labilithrix sp.]|nr:hypothetical protein [Labilithrix sp.]